MKALRWIVLLLVLGYTAWLGWPLLQHFMHPEGVEAQAGPGGLIAPASTQATPNLLLWAAAIGLYLISALLFAGKNARALIAYVLAFGSNVALMLLQRPTVTTMARRVGPDTPGGIEPMYLVLGALALIGVLMLVVVNARRPRHA